MKLIKKFFSIALCLAVLLSVVGCGAENDENSLKEPTDSMSEYTDTTTDSDLTSDETSDQTSISDQTSTSNQTSDKSSTPQVSTSLSGGSFSNTNILDGKRIIFVGNSFTYYGKTVLEKTTDKLTQAERSNDKGFFYQLCKENGANVSVTNWTFGSHDFTDLFESTSCDAKPEKCGGVNHLDYLTDRNFDYVVLQESHDATPQEFLTRCTKIINIFKAANPNTKFIFLVHSSVYTSNGTGYQWKNAVKDLKSQGVTIADWGALVCDVIDGKVTVSGSTQTYNKNSFIISKSSSDGYHPNMLTGYITTLMTYCAITGESAVGKDYSFCNNSSINSAFNFTKFISSYYTYNGATTNFPEIFASKSDMKGIQQLIDRYINR